MFTVAESAREMDVASSNVCPEKSRMRSQALVLLSPTPPLALPSEAFGGRGCNSGDPSASRTADSSLIDQLWWYQYMILEVF